MNARNNHSLITTLAAAILALPVAMPATAQDSGRAASAAQAAPAQGGMDMRASKLIGMEVKNASGEDVGEIKDLIVDLKAERVNYAVLSYGGALGVGDKLFAFPIKTFKPASDSDKLVLNVDKDKLKEAPGFDKNSWPDMANSKYREEVDRYFSKNAVGAAPKGQRLERVSALIGKNANDRNGANAGEIEDLVINPATERVRYVVFDLDKKWSPDDMLVTLPLGAFRFPEAKGRDLVLDMSREQMASARRFDEKEWPNLNARSFRREVDAFLARFQKDRRANETERSSGGSR